jgi:hypothetical protein
MRATILIFATIAVFACGSDPGSPHDPGGAGGGEGAGDGAESGGEPGDEPGATGGSGGPGAASSATIEPLDDGGECAGLLPSTIPTPVVVHRAPVAACTAGTSDGTGSVALGARDASGEVTWEVFTPGGEPRGGFEAAEILPQSSGWHALRVGPADDDAPPLVDYVAFGPDGAPRRAETVSPDPSAFTGFRWALGPDPAGGGFVLFRAVTLRGNHWHVLRGHRFESSGARRWPRDGAFLRSDSDPLAPWFMAAAVSRRGDALVLYQDSAFLVPAWADAAGEVTEGHRAERYADVLGSDSLDHELRLEPLLDGSLALSANGRWRRVYPHRALESAPLPEWLASRSEWTFRSTRGNRGYALFPPPGRGSAGCAQTIEIVAPTGRLCGRITLREGGSGCTTGAVDQGWDGTVVQQSGRDACTYRWWPRLLAR